MLCPSQNITELFSDAAPHKLRPAKKISAWGLSRGMTGRVPGAESHDGGWCNSVSFWGCRGVIKGCHCTAAASVDGGQ